MSKSGEEYTIISPTPNDLKLIKANLTHAPSSMILKNRKTKRRQGKLQPFIKDGVTISKPYYPEGPRPQPRLSNLEQSITVTMSSSTFLIATSITVPVYAGITFALSLFGSYTAYTSVFDQYRIDEIEAWVESANQNNTIATCRLATSVDLDDGAAPANFGDVADKQGALITNCIAGHYHRWAPHVAIAEYSGAFTSYGNVPSTWIDAASPSVEHYGLKFATDAVDGVVRNVYVNYRARISFRGSAI